LPGGDWISAELVAGESMLDELLASVGSLAVGLRESNVIERWFFIRFWDPVPHIRLRFRGKPQRLRSEAWPALLDTVGHGQTQGIIDRIRLETYVPEINRYGGPEAIDEAEAFFEADSTMALALMQLDRGGGDFRERTALMASHALLCDFTLDAAGREVFATERATDLSAETHIERVPIGRLFRELRSELESLLGSSPELLPAPLREARSVIAARSPAAAKYYGWCRGLEAEGKLTSPLRSILASLIHMQLFRLARVAPPLLELVIYDVLRRHYRAERAMGAPT
jgi:thiopeptide-type bacteriocin biosynthesis protein